jgi:probable H4MPT-linked C1 transfer pathway protein
MNHQGAECIGWDVGGAHLKAARAVAGRIAGVVQEPCPLWLGRERLAAALAAVRRRLGEAPLHQVTLTGELADVFASRREGVAWIAAAMAAALAPGTVRIYAAGAGFLAAEAAAAHAEAVASANWHAAAALAARAVPEALFADMGSTTTDLVPIRGGALAARGHTDAERLAAGELIYTGLTRSFVMALAPAVPMNGTWTPLACEYFASTADVYRVLGELEEEADQMPTADGRDKTRAASCARLARMVGRDAGSAPLATWQALAAFLAEAQLRRIADGAMLVLSAIPLAPEAPLIGAGVGRQVLERLAARLDRRFVAFADLPGLAGIEDEWLGHCAPAVAMALL